jgi:ABC-type branched-subunit amino acid transport system permease subunit
MLSSDKLPVSESSPAPAPARSQGPAAAIVGVIAIAVFATILLRVHDQWALLALGVVAAIALVAAVRTGATARFEGAFASHERLMNGVVVAAVLAVIAVLAKEDFSLLIVSTVLLYCTACMGLTVQLGYCGVLNFAGAAFFGAGAYTAAVLGAHTALPHLLVVLAGGCVAGLLGSVLLLPVLRTRGHYAALITVAFGIMFRSFLEVNNTLGGPQGLMVPGMTIFGWSLNQGLAIGGLTLSFYFNYALVALGLAIAVYVVTRRLERSWVGMHFDAVRIDELAASTFGLNVQALKIGAFVIGNVFIGMAGALFAMMTGFISPTDFDFSTSLVLIAIIMLGGIGNVWGILPAAAFVLILPEKLQAIQEYRFLLYAAAVILVLLFRPDGLFPRRLRRYFPSRGRG